MVVNFQITPKGLRKVLNYIKDRYGEKWEIIITENGFIDDGEIVDEQRIVYIAVSGTKCKVCCVLAPNHAAIEQIWC
jgi:beta-glucosidase/6-phospho-beta-glucosidase/beta-galactosidase